MRLAGLGAATTALSTRSASVGGQPTDSSGSAMAARCALLRPGRACVDRDASTPAGFARSWNFSGLAADRRARHYRERPASRRHAAARIRHRRRRSRDRDRAGRLLSRVDVQRPGARTDDARHRRRSRPGDLPQPGHRTRTRFTSTAGIRRRWTARCPSTRSCRARRFVYEFDAEPVRPAPLSLPRRAAEAPHPQGPLRRVHRRSAERRASRPTSS